MPDHPYGRLMILLKEEVLAEIRRHQEISPNTEARQMVDLVFKNRKQDLQRKLAQIQSGEIADESGTEELTTLALIDYFAELEPKVRRMF